MVKCKTVPEKTYEQIEDLFKEIRLCLTRVREENPTVAEDMKSLVHQLELWVDSLVVDSIKLHNLENLMHRASDLAKKLGNELDGGRGSRRDMAAVDIARLLKGEVGSDGQPEGEMPERDTV